MSAFKYITPEQARANCKSADAYKHYREEANSKIIASSKKGHQDTTIYFSDSDFEDFWFTARSLVMSDLKAVGFKVYANSCRRGHSLVVSWEK